MRMRLVFFGFSTEISGVRYPKEFVEKGTPRYLLCKSRFHRKNFSLSYSKSFWDSICSGAYQRRASSSAPPKKRLTEVMHSSILMPSSRSAFFLLLFLSGIELLYSRKCAGTTIAATHSCFGDSVPQVLSASACLPPAYVLQG